MTTKEQIEAMKKAIHRAGNDWRSFDPETIAKHQATAALNALAKCGPSEEQYKYVCAHRVNKQCSFNTCHLICGHGIVIGRAMKALGEDG